MREEGKLLVGAKVDTATKLLFFGVLAVTVPHQGPFYMCVFRDLKAWRYVYFFGGTRVQSKEPCINNGEMAGYWRRSIE